MKIVVLLFYLLSEKYIIIFIMSLYNDNSHDYVRTRNDRQLIL